MSARSCSASDSSQRSDVSWRLQITNWLNVLKLSGYHQEAWGSNCPVSGILGCGKWHGDHNSPISIIISGNKSVTIAPVLNSECKFTRIFDSTCGFLGVSSETVAMSRSLSALATFRSRSTRFSSKLSAFSWRWIWSCVKKFKVAKCWSNQELVGYPWIMSCRSATRGSLSWSCTWSDSTISRTLTGTKHQVKDGETNEPRKNLLTFRYTGCLIGILEMIYYNPHITD